MTTTNGTPVEETSVELGDAMNWAADIVNTAINLLTVRKGLGRKYGSVWLFTRKELDAYRDAPRLHGGRPAGSKIGTVIASPAFAG